jgi:hypothetical protein
MRLEKPLAEPAPRKARATEIHAARKFTPEKFREDWQRQLVADRTITLTALKVAIAICWHMNRETTAWRDTLGDDLLPVESRCRRFIVFEKWLEKLFWKVMADQMVRRF